MRRLLWFPVICGVLVWLLIVPLIPCDDEAVENKPRGLKPTVPRPDVGLPKAA